jgi:hypothetical protein
VKKRRIGADHEHWAPFTAQKEKAEKRGEDPLQFHLSWKK